MNLPIHIAVIEHMSGMDLHAATTEDDLNKILAGYCRMLWYTATVEPDMDAPEVPTTDADIIERYFDEHESDSLTTDCIPLELPEPRPLVLHTFENTYDEDHTYRQFLQRGADPMEAVSLCGAPQTIRQFLEELHGELGLEDDPGPDDDWNEDPEFDGPRTVYNFELQTLIAAGDIAGFLVLAQWLAQEGSEVPADHVCQTNFGEWTHDTIDLDTP